MTLMLMFKEAQLFKAGVSGAPVTDWTLYDTHYTERYLGKPQDNAGGYEQSAVFPYVDGLHGKLLLIHGMSDDNVLFLNSTKLFRRLQDLGKPFDVMVYPGGKHGLMRQHDGRHGYATMLRFFNSSLMPAAGAALNALRDQIHAGCAECPRALERDSPCVHRQIHARAQCPQLIVRQRLAHDQKIRRGGGPLGIAPLPA